MYCIVSCMLSVFYYQFILLLLHCRQWKYKHICGPSKINIIYLFLALHLCRFFSLFLTFSITGRSVAVHLCQIWIANLGCWIVWVKVTRSQYCPTSVRTCWDIQCQHSHSGYRGRDEQMACGWLLGRASARERWRDREREREKWAFRGDVKFSIVELNEKWDAPTLQRQTNTTQLEHTGGICWCGIVRKCNIIQLSINFYSGERGKYVLYNLFFWHVIFTGHPVALMNSRLQPRSNLVMRMTALREPTLAKQENKHNIRPHKQSLTLAICHSAGSLLVFYSNCAGPITNGVSKACCWSASFFS